MGATPFNNSDPQDNLNNKFLILGKSSARRVLYFAKSLADFADQTCKPEEELVRAKAPT